MTSQPTTLTWSSLLAHYAAPAWQALAQLARASYAQQGQLLTAAQYLALAPAAAAAPFVDSAEAQQLVAQALPAATDVAAATFADYAARATPPAQPLLRALGTALLAQGLTPTTLEARVAEQGAAEALAPLLTPAAWATLAGAIQQQALHQLDAEGRAAAFQAAAPLLGAAYPRLLAAYPDAALETLRDLPANELARALWTPRPSADDLLRAPLLGQLRAAAQQAVAANYPDNELTDYLLAQLDPALVGPARALLLPAAAGQEAFTSAAELAQADPAPLAARLSALPANHPLVYALAAAFQEAVQLFLRTQSPPQPAPALAPLAVQGQLLGAQGVPLPGFGLALRQVLAGPAGGERPLGLLTTEADGHFALRVPRDRYLADDDTVAEAPASLRAAVYRPGQDPAGEPALTLLLEPGPDAAAPLTLVTDLAPTAPAPTSAEVAALADTLPDALRTILAANNITSLAEVRAAGGLQLLAADLVLDDPATTLAVRRLDGLAQFEVVGGEDSLRTQVVDAGFYSPGQLLDTTSEPEFVARLTAADPTNPALAQQASAFYQQAAAVQALSQTLGLLAATQPAPGGPAPTPISALAAAPETTFFTAESIDYQQAAIIEEEAPGGVTTQSFGPVTSADEDNTASLTGYGLVDGLNPSVASQTLAYQPGGQCDCPACRSAVGPTAYLAALLKYATQNLRDTSGATPTAPSPKNLQDKFLQPFCDLGVSCQSADEPVCQYRLAIEAIQAYWRAQVGGSLPLSAARPYVEGVLEALLQALGTDLAEVRALTPATRPALATRLAVPEALLTLLQARFGTAQLADSRPLDEVEADLAEVFGLASTATDPLRTGQLLSANTGAIQLVRWSLQGVGYGRNTNVDGQLHLEVTPAVGTTPAHLTVYTGLENDQHVVRAGERTEDNVVARGTLLRTSPDPAATTYSAVLYPQHGSELRGSVVLTLGAGAATTTFSLAVVPRLTAARQQALSASWLSQDAAAIDLLQAHSQPSWNGAMYLIDPDLLGPDDFRPLAPAAPSYANRAFIIWRRRYEFLQYEVVPALLDPSGSGLAVPGSATLGTILDALTQRVITYASTGTPVYKRVAWGWLSTGPGTELLSQLHAQLSGPDAATTQQTVGSLGLSPEGLTRLYDLWQASLTQTLPEADVQEAFDLVRQTVKKSFELFWGSEEGIDLAPNRLGLSVLEFQRALHEPLVGVWDYQRPAEFGLKASELPRLDPDEVTPLDLPDAGLGDAAAQRWGARQAELLRKRQAILAIGVAALASPPLGATAAALQLFRANVMLSYAYHPSDLPPSPPFASLEAAWTAYQSPADAQHAAAVTYITQTLALRPAEAERLLGLRAQVQAQPAEALWQEMAALLTLGWKRAVAYRSTYAVEGTEPFLKGALQTPPPTYAPSWRAQETATPAPAALDQLLATRKHRLVKWRASAADRAAWVAALDLATQRPLLDPDQLVPGDFRQAGERSRSSYFPALAPADKPFLNPAFDLYQQRVAVVEKWFAQDQASWNTVLAAANPAARKTQAYALFNSLLYALDGELEALYTQQQANVDVSARLRRLLLTPDGLALLVTQANGLGTDRAAEVPHLLVQVRRQRQYAAWAREEVARRLVPTPYFFRLPQAEAESLAALPWRSSAVARRQWQRTLAARFGQAEALSAAQQQAVKAAEDQYLPLLRDALLLAKVGTGADTLATRASFLEDKYLLDFQTACCQHTTRVAQALEVLQKLFQQVRGGLASNNISLAAGTTTFEQDWQWLSSYERWRSLMFLYLYPQNVLLPALKPGQTSQLRQTVSDIRQAAGLSPAAARQYMDDYQAFLTDMGSLVVATATQTTISPGSTDGFTAPPAAQAVSVQVALAASRAAYANVFNLTGSPGETAFSWTRLPGAALVERVVGSAAYQPADGQRYVYVFALLREDQKNALATSASLYLAFQRLNLRSLRWDDDYTRLSVSDMTTLNAASVQVVHGGDETWAPVVLGLRNVRVPLYTEYPFSQSPYSQGSVTDTGDALALDRVLNEVYNTDLFFVLLDTQGTGIGLEQTRTFFLSAEVTLLAGVRVRRDVVFFSAAMRTGYYSTVTLSNFRVLLSDFGSKTKYLISNDFSTTGALTTTGTGGNQRTTLFRAGARSTYFQGVINNINSVLDLGTGLTLTDKFPIEHMGVSVVTNQTATRVRVELAAAHTTLVPAGARIEPTQVITPATANSWTLDKFYLTIFYNKYRQATPSLDDIDTYALRFYFDSLSLYSQKDNPQTSAASLISQFSLPRNYLGPALRSGYVPGTTPVSATAVMVNEVVENANSRYQRNASIVTAASGGIPYLLHAYMSALPPLFSALTPTALTARRSQLQAAVVFGEFGDNLLSEAYYALPLLLAQELMRARNYELALHYFRLVYDYTRLSSTGTPDAGRLVYPALASAATATYTSANVQAWLQNPNNPYTLAALRPNAHLEYVVMSVVRCLLAYADSEFTTDSTESVARARTYYELAARLLRQDIAPAVVPGTAELLDPLDVLFPAAWLAEWQSLKAVLARVNQRPVLEQLLYRATVDGSSGRGLRWLFDPAQRSTKPWVVAFDQAWQLVNGQLDALPGGYLSLCATTGSPALATTPTIGSLPAGSVRPYVPFLDNTAFCIPTNPVPLALALQAELNLFKIRSCRNIAGIQRELDPYAAATDTTTGLPTLSSTGQLVRSGRLVVPATPFRYAYIMERARNLVALAQQTEASLLAALEKRDAEAYNLLKARQDIATSQATVQLQTLRVTEAEDGVDLAGLQLERSQIMEDQYDGWLSDGLNEWENTQLAAIMVAGAAKAVAAAVSKANVFDIIGSGGTEVLAAAAGAAAAIADATASVAGLQASYQRRENEWKFQRNLAAQDIKIGQQQIRISNDQLKVVGQEKRIAQLQLDHAASMLSFLTTKFTNAELYDWMSGILENAYSYFLQQATATARLAEQQLAFERQAVPAGIVQEDYYSAPADDLTSASLVGDGTGAASATDRKGLTGSVRLLQDLTRLDEYAFETTRRKLQLTKTISLAQSFPTEFVRFRATGTLAFACQPEWFDQDFPGQYLRVLRRVRTSVIALVPPVDGIKARLSTAGTSHVTVDGAPFQTLALPRAPEAVALSAPLNATGLFELEPQSTELLYPFEGLGVDVPWTFAMQPASNPNLDYSAVADVLISLDYTALESADYARQVVQQLGTTRRQVVALSLRDRFADQWYDLHHAADLAPADQYRALLTLTPDDLPRALRQARVSQVSLFVDAPLDDDPALPGAFTDRSHLELRLTRGAAGGAAGGAAFTNQYGLISTRTGSGAGPLYTGNAAALVPLLGTAPAGSWALAVGPGRLRQRLDAGLVNDIYLILEVEGEAPAYVL